MYISHISSEFSPFAKAGGLGDVLHGLSKQQIKNGHDVEVIIPKYDIINLKDFDTFEIYTQDLWSYEDNIEYHNTVYKATFEGITIFLIEPHHNNYYFNRGTIYGSVNDIERFLYFSRAAIEFLIHEKKYPHVLHLHDWPVAVIAPLICHMAPILKKNIGSIIFNIHNIEHQGRIHPKHLTRIGLKGEEFLTKQRMQDPISPSLVNLMKGAITYADKVITVSPSYAYEITTAEYSFGLHTTIEKFKDKLHGIINGIETETWNPATDKYLFENFPSNSTYINEILRKKSLNKKKLYETLDMKPTTNGPLVICISRLASQKSPLLILRALYQTIEKGGCFILLGGFCEKAIAKKFIYAQQNLKNNPNIHLCFTFNEKLAHQLFASADTIFIPSKFEPCGLTQLISMRYGTVPIVRNTGGLKDTVQDISHSLPTGFIFEDLTEKAVDQALEEAFNIYHNDQSTWQNLIKNGINQDYSWRSPANNYEKVYLEANDTKTAM